MTIKRVTVAGGGVLGSQIAYQAACYGFDVIQFDISKEALETAKVKIHTWAGMHHQDLGTPLELLEKAEQSITYTDDIQTAFADVDLVIEAIAERLDIKKAFWTSVADVAPASAIFVTNTSTLLPSTFKEETKRPDRFLALHFMNLIWKKNVVELMRIAETSDEVFDTVYQFAKDINMVPAVITKEHPGYIINTTLLALEFKAMELKGSGVAEPWDIDRAWKALTGELTGPFAVQDYQGFVTVSNVLGAKYNREQADWQAKMLDFFKDKIAKNETGFATQNGFYTYPNPEFAQSTFFDNSPAVKGYTHAFKRVVLVSNRPNATDLEQLLIDKGFDVTRLTPTADLASLSTADLIIEDLAESIEDKANFYQAAKPFISPDTVLVTTTATIRPSQLASYLTYRQNFAALNLTSLPQSRLGEVMKLADTSEATFEALQAFVRDLDALVLPLLTEQIGFITGSLYASVFQAALYLYANDISSVESIDKVWMICRESKRGPFAIMDDLGLEKVAEILLGAYNHSPNPILTQELDILKAKLEAKEYGHKIGKGFYDYSQGVPYQAADFLM